MCIPSYSQKTSVIAIKFSLKIPAPCCSLVLLDSVFSHLQVNEINTNKASKLFSMNLVILSSDKAAGSCPCIPMNLVASKAFSTMLHVCLSSHVLMIRPSSSTTSHACNCHLTFTRLQERSNMTFTLIAVTREFISSKPR